MLSVFFSYYSNNMEEIHEPISVIIISDAIKRSVRPFRVKWRNRIYQVKEIASHYSMTSKGIFFHYYSVSMQGCNMLLKMNGDTLLWELESITTRS